MLLQLVLQSHDSPEPNVSETAKIAFKMVDVNGAWSFMANTSINASREYLLKYSDQVEASITGIARLQ